FAVVLEQILNPIIYHGLRDFSTEKRKKRPLFSVQKKPPAFSRVGGARWRLPGALRRGPAAIQLLMVD
ncbi:MAG: hypothetical protein J6W70_04820, partial [Lentisphaeria bacterium]|nr:hypothetical protein [Lentisphaeria bacterium]